MHGVTTMPSYNCLRCGHENSPGAKFCLECGSPFALKCANCGAALPSTAKFCPECGAAGGGTERVLAGDPASPHLVKPTADENLGNATILNGELKLITVLFADMKGSLEAIAHSDPEEVTAILDPVVEQMKESVHRYGGTVNRVMGDGIMALFGAPLSLEDHAVRACYAALVMQAAISSHRDEARRKYGVEVQIRVGINSGDTLVRTIEHDVSREYAAVGVTTHLAARMEQLALPGTIRITAETLKLAEGYIEVKSLGPVPIKGLPDPVEVYELIGASKAHSRFQASALRGLTGFVGRDTEIEHLRRLLGQAGASRGQVVAIVGQAGVGKSRLTYEFTHSHRVQDWLILEASSVSYGKATSYLPVIDLLKGYFKIGDRDDHREMRDKVLGRVLGLDRTLEPLLPVFLSLLDVPVEDAAWISLDPPQRRQRTLDAVKRLLLRESQVQPLLVVFEDLHWVDGETQALLDSIVESLGSARLLLLVNYRPEYEHHWSSKTAYSQLRLDSLPAESAAQLLAALLGPDPGLAPLVQMLVKRGNPFFLEETVRTLVETGALAGERGAYRLTRPVETLQVPATVQTILAARIDRLPQEEKQLLQAASVIGKDVAYALLSAIAAQPDNILRRGLAHLQEAEFLYETQLFPDLEYTFTHALTHEVAYGSVLQERRKALHTRVMESIERLYHDRLAEQIERLAHHAFRSEVWGKAVGYLRQAGAKAFACSANREAATLFDQALQASEHLPQTRDTIEQAIDIRFDLRNSLYPLAEFGRLHALLREAETLSESLGDEARLARVSSYLTHYFWVAGKHDRAVEIGERSLSSASQPDSAPPAEVMASTWALGQAYHALGKYQPAVDFYQRLLAAVEGERVGSHFGSHGLPLIFSRSWLTRALSELGRFDHGLAYAEEGVRLAEALGHPFSLTVAYWGVGYLHLRRGSARDAIPALERAVELCKTWNFLVGSPTSAALLGYAYALSGRIAEGLPLLTEAVAQSSSMRVLFSHSLEAAFLGEAYLLADKVDNAVKVAEHALEVARERNERGYQAWILRLQGEIATSTKHGTNGKAQIYYEQAAALATELGMRPLEAQCHFALGELAKKAGETRGAQEQLEKAASMFRDMGMQSWLEKADAAWQNL